jgi:type II secretory pathway pseudopilin PulG
MNRKGLTLLDLIVAIAIIIILVAIAIPSYSSMMNKARRSAVVAEFANLATVLGTFERDWGHYPLAAAGCQGIAPNDTRVFRELTTEGSAAALTNVAGAKTIHGDAAPIVYIGAAALSSMTNPFVTSTSDPQYRYATDGAGTAWVLYVRMETSETASYLVCTDRYSSIVESAVEPTL